MAHFLYNICLFRWARIGPIYLGNLFMVFLFFGGPMLFAWLNQKGYNIFEVVIWSFKYIIRYLFNLIIRHVINNYKIKNLILFIIMLTVFVPNNIIKFILIFLLSNIIIWQNLLYYDKNYINYRFNKKVYFFIYFITLFGALWILKFSIFINVIPYVIITFHLLYWFIAKK